MNRVPSSAEPGAPSSAELKAPSSVRCKTLSLLKAVLSEGMNILVYRTRSDKKRHFLPLILALVIFGTLFGSAYYLAADLREDGKQYIVLALFVLMTTVLTIMEGIYKSGSLLFNCRDNDLLLAMPIKKSTITFLRIFKFFRKSACQII